MSVELIELIAARGVFRPRGHFSQLAADHVPFDHLTDQDRYEATALQALGNDEPVGVIGPRGAGKSSLIAHVCARLPDTHVALRVPVTGADDPSSVSVVAAVALSQALDDLDLERYQREALDRARADQQTNQRARRAARRHPSVVGRSPPRCTPSSVASVKSSRPIASPLSGSQALTA